MLPAFFMPRLLHSFVFLTFPILLSPSCRIVSRVGA
nr:MAG TPA: hypothetical protein [Caudoviricetes sp.]